MRNPYLDNMVQDDSTFLLYSTWGWSMFPFIRSDDYVVVKKVPLETIRPGDIIVFESGSKTKICHHVVGIKKINDVLWFYTKGHKSVSSNSEPTAQDKVLGKVVGIKRKTSKNIIGLPVKGLDLAAFKFNCCLTENIACLKRFLARIPFLRIIYKYTLQTIKDERNSN